MPSPSMESCLICPTVPSMPWVAGEPQTDGCSVHGPSGQAAPPGSLQPPSGSTGHLPQTHGPDSGHPAPPHRASRPTQGPAPLSNSHPVLRLWRRPSPSPRQHPPPAWPPRRGSSVLTRGWGSPCVFSLSPILWMHTLRLREAGPRAGAQSGGLQSRCPVDPPRSSLAPMEFK